MRESKADLILHPVRMRILMAVALKPMTAGQISEVLTDVAQATLYRHLKLLADANILAVVEEHPSRGTVEKVYALQRGATYLNPNDAASLSHEDHLRSFIMFVTTLIGDYERYLSRADAAPHKEVSYSKVPVYMTDEELVAVSRAINQALLPLLHNTPGPGRRRRIIASILLPDPDVSDTDDSDTDDSPEITD